uniref:von Willebrand factor A domain-containing protein 5A-like isoform X1 n=1 Tax=Pogona vitticeps TaxID=103695 RepID=A0ABM5GSF8_9SAUR
MTVGGLLTSTQAPVPLRSISVDVVIQGFVADVVSVLQYHNGETNPVEVSFVFPLDAEASVYAFEGLIGGTQIEAQIQEKKQAEQEYENALSEGREAFLLERDEKTSDIFTCVLGNLPPDGEATLKLRYVQSLAPEPDGALRFVLPAVLNPRYVPQGSEGDTVLESIPRVPKGQLPYTLSLSATVESPYGINRVESKCTLKPLRYTTETHTAAQIALADGHQFDRDVELLIYYNDIHKPSVILEAGKSRAPPGSLMGNPALLLTLYPELPTPKPAPNATGEFIFLLDRSGSMDFNTGSSSDSPSRIQSAKETLVFLLKSLPLGCYFNIYGFGSNYDSFYPQSVEYTQQTMSESLERIKNLMADLGGTEILRPLKAIYSQPCQERHPRQLCLTRRRKQKRARLNVEPKWPPQVQAKLFVFTDGEVDNTDEVIFEVRRHSSSHRCFSFGIGEGASTALVKGMAQAAGGSAEFITDKERMQAKALQTLKKALQPAVTGVSLHWNLPSGLEAVLVGSGPSVIFPGYRCLIFAQIRGQLQSPHSTEGSVVLQYIFQDQTFSKTLKFPLQAQESDRLPVHRLAAQALLQELEMAGEMEEEKKHLALETSLSSGVVCSQTAYIGVNKELGKPIQGPLVHQVVPLTDLLTSSCSARHPRSADWRCLEADLFDDDYEAEALQTFQHRECCGLTLSPTTSLSISDAKDKESPLFRLISLQNADGSWSFDSGLVSALSLDETDASSKTPPQVALNVWGTLLAILWLHSMAKEQRDEWELLEAKAHSWLKANAGPRLAECVQAGNALLGTSVSPQVFGI